MVLYPLQLNDGGDYSISSRDRLSHSFIGQFWGSSHLFIFFQVYDTFANPRLPPFKGVVNCQNSQDKGPPEGNSARR